MKFKVNVFLNGEKINPADLSKLVITSPTVDRIVNDIIDNNSEDELVA